MENRYPSGGEVFARRVRQVRKRRDWTQQRLAEEMGKVGHPMPRGSIAKLESGVQRPENISLETALALCAALGVPPVSMLATLEPYELMQVTPAITRPSSAVRLWIRGGHPLRGPADDDPDDLRTYFIEHPLDELQALQQQYAADIAAGQGAPMTAHYPPEEN